VGTVKAFPIGISRHIFVNSTNSNKLSAVVICNINKEARKR